MHFAAAGQVDDEIAGLGRDRNARVGVVEADRARRHTHFFQRDREFAPDRGFLAGHALDGEKAHQAGEGGGVVDGHGCPLV